MGTIYENILGFVILAAVLYGAYWLYGYLNDRKKTKAGGNNGGTRPGIKNQ